MKALTDTGILTRHDYHGEWNYSLNPPRSDTPDLHRVISPRALYVRSVDVVEHGEQAPLLVMVAEDQFGDVHDRFYLRPRADAGRDGTRPAAGMGARESRATRPPPDALPQLSAGVRVVSVIRCSSLAVCFGVRCE
jgi:hypothetical protein